MSRYCCFIIEAFELIFNHLFSKKEQCVLKMRAKSNICLSSNGTFHRLFGFLNFNLPNCSKELVPEQCSPRTVSTEYILILSPSLLVILILSDLFLSDPSRCKQQEIILGVRTPDRSTKSLGSQLNHSGQPPLTCLINKIRQE